MERIGSQIEQLDQKFELEGLVIPQGIVTPPMGSPQQEVQQLIMVPGLPLFSGSEPTPHDEGTDEQWKFQVKGMRSSYPVTNNIRLRGGQQACRIRGFQFTIISDPRSD